MVSNKHAMVVAGECSQDMQGAEKDGIELASRDPSLTILMHELGFSANG